jgi:ubiquinone/menaquinone biosynthesis C-methylase UbiE
MKKVETEFKDQSRWDEGHSLLDEIKADPQRFVIDPARLAKPKRDLVAVISPLEGKRVLDFGSGRGELSVALAKLGATVTGIDIGPTLVEMAKTVASVNGVTCEFVVGSITALPFPDESFDVVVGSAILHHLPRQGVIDALAEAYRVLRIGGRALFVEPIENSRLFDLAQNLLPVGKPGTPRYRPSVLQRAEWRAYLEAADDRSLSNAELMASRGRFPGVDFRYYGWLARLERVTKNAEVRKGLAKGDEYLTHPYSPVKKLSQTTLVTFWK